MKPKLHHLSGMLLLVALLAFTGCGGKNARKNRTATFAKPGGSTSRVLGKQNAYSRVGTNRSVIALTFDDGPHPQNTPRLLNILKSRNVKATFFVTGENARKHPSILRQMIAEGHEIANHTMTHGRITGMSEGQVRQEIEGTQQAIESATGVRARSFRPPYGAISEGQKGWIKATYGMPSILWSVDPEDWKKPGVGVVTNRLLQGATPGGILLLHDIHSTSVDATLATIDQLKKRGFQFVTISQLISLEG